MGHVQVTAEDDGLLRVELLQIVTESILPRHTVFEALQTVLRVRRVAADKIEVLHLQRDHTTLVVVQIDADAVADADRLVLREDGSA